MNRSTFLRLKRLAAGEGIEPSSSGSKPDVLPITPSRKSHRVSGHWDSNPEPRADLALKPLIRRLLFQLSYAPLKLVAVEGIEPTSLEYRSSALAVELHREVVDPTGLKPAPHGLKGRRSVTRAPGQKDWLWRKDSNRRMAALTVRCLTNLATPQKGRDEVGRMKAEAVCVFRFHLHSSFFGLEAMKGVEPLSSGLQDRRSCIPI